MYAPKLNLPPSIPLRPSYPSVSQQRRDASSMPAFKRAHFARHPLATRNRTALNPSYFTPGARPISRFTRAFSFPRYAAARNPELRRVYCIVHCTPSPHGVFLSFPLLFFAYLPFSTTRAKKCFHSKLGELYIDRTAIDAQQRAEKLFYNLREDNKRFSPKRFRRRERTVRFAVTDRHHNFSFG